MQNKLFALIIILVLVFLLTSCGANKESVDFKDLKQRAKAVKEGGLGKAIYRVKTIHGDCPHGWFIPMIEKYAGNVYNMR